MRRLKLQVQVTLDHFVAARAGTMAMFACDRDDALRRRPCACGKVPLVLL